MVWPSSPRALLPWLVLLILLRRVGDIHGGVLGIGRRRCAAGHGKECVEAELRTVRTRRAGSDEEIPVRSTGFGVLTTRKGSRGVARVARLPGSTRCVMILAGLHPVRSQPVLLVGGVESLPGRWGRKPYRRTAASCATMPEQSFLSAWL